MAEDGETWVEDAGKLIPVPVSSGSPEVMDAASDIDPAMNHQPSSDMRWKRTSETWQRYSQCVIVERQAPQLIQTSAPEDRQAVGLHTGVRSTKINRWEVSRSTTKVSREERHWWRMVCAGATAKSPTHALPRRGARCITAGQNYFSPFSHGIG